MGRRWGPGAGKRLLAGSQPMAELDPPPPGGWGGIRPAAPPPPWVARALPSTLVGDEEKPGAGRGPTPAARAAPKGRPRPPEGGGDFPDGKMKSTPCHGTMSQSLGPLSCASTLFVTPVTAPSTPIGACPCEVLAQGRGAVRHTRRDSFRFRANSRAKIDCVKMVDLHGFENKKARNLQMCEGFAKLFPNIR